MWFSKLFSLFIHLFHYLIYLFIYCLCGQLNWCNIKRGDGIHHRLESYLQLSTTVGQFMKSKAANLIYIKKSEVDKCNCAVYKVQSNLKCHALGEQRRQHALKVLVLKVFWRRHLEGID